MRQPRSFRLGGTPGGLLLAVLIATAGLAGCQAPGEGPAPKTTEAPAGSFIREWQNDLSQRGRGEVNRVELLGDSLVLLTDENFAYVFDVVEGTIRFSRQVAEPDEALLPPVRVNDLFAFPLRGTINIYNPRGDRVKTTNLGRALASGVYPHDDLLYAGTSTGQQGRLAVIAPLKQYRNIINDVAIGLIEARPVFHEGLVFAANTQGRVYAVTANRNAAWAAPGYFQTEGPIRANLKADNFAVYVASTDSKLYALDRGTGRIRWQYFAQSPLEVAPFLAEDYLYQPLPGNRLAAIEKRAPSTFREPLWEASGVRQVVSTDEQYVYVVLDDGRLAALEQETGEVAFTSQRENLVLVAQNEADATIYALTADGRVLAIRPNLQRGVFGEVVQASTTAGPRPS